MPPPKKKAKVSMPACDGAVRRKAFECKWAELSPEQLGAAAVLGLDALSWPQWVSPELLPAQPGEDNVLRRTRSFAEALGNRWPDCEWDIVRHRALTWKTWEDLDAAERGAATILGYTSEVWESFHAEDGLGIHGWFLAECGGDIECWANGGTCQVFRCGHGCQPIRCPNFAVCGDESDGFMVELKGRCLTCDVNFGENLDILDAATADEAGDCPICMEKAATVKLPQCTHRFCGGCVKTLFFPDGGDPHLQIGGGSQDRGCPICRGKTLAPAWALNPECRRSRNVECSCRRCRRNDVFLAARARA